MAPREIRLEELLGRAVIGPGGALDRIEDVVAEPEGEAYVVKGFLLGSASPWAKVTAFFWQIPTLRALGLGRKGRQRVISWELIDLSDPARPRLRTSGDTPEADD